MSAISLIVGLGNPGDKYKLTRHNAGFWFLDQLAQQYNCQFKTESKFYAQIASLQGFAGAGKLHLLKPTTFMNLSGKAVGAFANFYKIPASQILLVHDELDLATGTARFKLGGGHGGHNGLRDTAKALQTADFWRLRLGIDHPGHSHLVSNYVLSKPSATDAANIQHSIESALFVIEQFSCGQSQQAMAKLHSKGK